MSNDNRPAFSLVEVLLAILILGIGIVSIAALFPAGIAQQRLANDDVMGPMVANNAISIIRTKVRQEDFGTFDELQSWFDAAPQGYFSRTLAGDWDWMRPGLLMENDGETDFDERGAIDIFSFRATHQEWGTWFGTPNAIAVATEIPLGWPDPAVWSVAGDGGPELLYGIPYDSHRYYNNAIDRPSPPNFIISQRERYYPMQSSLVEEVSQPQYVWDCMFRRYQGRVYVAIFVYRISTSNTAAQYVAPMMLPHRIDFLNPPTLNPPTQYSGPRDVLYANGRAISEMIGSEGVAILAHFDPDSLDESWQRTRQWVLDQNNNVHRVMGSSHDEDDELIRVQLTQPLNHVMVPEHGGNITSNTTGGQPPFGNVLIPSDVAGYYFGDPGIDPNAIPREPRLSDVGVVTDLWYIPREVVVPQTIGGDEVFTLTPVFVTVKEL